MEVIEVMEKVNRNYRIEKDTITEMANILNPFITEEDIIKTLETNGFKGVYIIPKELFALVIDDLNTGAFFSIVDKVVFAEEDAYLKDPTIIKHELCHAYLNHRIYRKLNIDGTRIIYGQGIEEGICSVFQTINNLKDINNVRPTVYYFQSRLFQQLNTLYNYTNVNEYPNLLIHALKDPKNFLTLIRNIYFDILKENISSFDSFAAERSAHHLLTTADMFVNLPNLDSTLYDLTHIMNSLYLTIADADIYNGKKKTDLFYIPDSYIFKPEINLLFKLLGIDYEHEKRWLRNLDLIHMKIEDTFCSAEEQNYKDSKIKILGR